MKKGVMIGGGVAGLGLVFFFMSRGYKENLNMLEMASGISWAIWIFAFFIFMYKFVPLTAATGLKRHWSALNNNFAFNLVDGAVRIALFLLSGADMGWQWWRYYQSLKMSKQELRDDPCVLATGGLAGLIAPYSQSIDEVDPNLTLEGLRIIFERNRPATFRHPLYSFLGDWAMYRDVLTGRIPF